MPMAQKQHFEVNTNDRQQLIDITAQVERIVAQSGFRDGLAVVFTPHTTAGITINENADPDVQHDLLLVLDRLLPQLPEFRHAEGNSPGHAKSSLVGCSQTLIVEHGRLCLGTWQGIYFCEFDGPRTRRVWVRLIQDA
ncbi:MAG: secondary thiamine-phosphate synthase enzyme YjbQ [Candidatus Alcyoniella australis]|nr:secondary thiamine-phosphate synthase enzyme YjbQ [Candidatus Alcyoniella australis]